MSLDQNDLSQYHRQELLQRHFFQQKQDAMHEINLNLNETIQPYDAIQAMIMSYLLGKQRTSKKKSAISPRIFIFIFLIFSFPRMINFYGRRPYTSLRFLQTIIDLSSVARLSIQILIYICGQNSSLTDYISTILKKTTNVHSLKITYNHIEEPFISADILCSIIPHSVEHLQISIKNFAEAKIILEQLNQLFSITFYTSERSKYYDDIEKLVSFKRKNSVYREGVRCIQIWLGSSINNDNERHSVKRVSHRLRFRQAD